MTIRAGSLDRRTLLRGAIATAAVGSFAVACSSPSSKDSEGGGGPKGEKSATNPFGVAANSTVEAAIFDGGYGTDYVDYTNQVLGGQVKGLKVKVDDVSNFISFRIDELIKAHQEQEAEEARYSRDKFGHRAPRI